MTVAAIYARFSSDSQRDESIEIQVRECSEYIERRGWSAGEVYADYAMTGTNDRRPSFRRCIEDGEAGLYDVLVVYKYDRFARSVEVSRSYKRRLREAGRRIVSVREGESADTPDGFLHEAMDEAFAEYYSRNLSVLVKNGIDQSARELKACGVRVFGYSVDASDRFAVNPKAAPHVLRIFERYVAGESSTQIAAGLNADGVATPRGAGWTAAAVMRVLRSRRYIGEYSLAGHVVPGGMPAIVPESLFMAAQARADGRRIGRRPGTGSPYLLTGRARCLECGKPVFGAGGTGRSGRKYEYYVCGSEKHGRPCFRIPAHRLDDAVVGGLKAMLRSDGSLDAMVRAVTDAAASRPRRLPELEGELASVRRKVDRLLDSVADGMPAAAVAGKVRDLEGRARVLEGLVAEERAREGCTLDERTVRAFVARMLSDSETLCDESLVASFVDEVWTDGETTVAVLAVGDRSHEISIDEVRDFAFGDGSHEVTSGPQKRRNPPTVAGRRVFALSSYGAGERT